MYGGDIINDYDIDELVESFTGEDVVYAQYAAKFNGYPELNPGAISFKVLHAFANVEDISVKTLGLNENRWDKLCSSDKICLSSTFSFMCVLCQYANLS